MAGDFCGYRDQEDLDRHLLPSCWVKRLPRDQAVVDHITVSTEGGCVPHECMHLCILSRSTSLT